MVDGAHLDLMENAPKHVVEVSRYVVAHAQIQPQLMEVKLVPDLQQNLLLAILKNAQVRNDVSHFN